MKTGFILFDKNRLTGIRTYLNLYNLNDKYNERENDINIY
jgi:hypothetical protein